jgi:AraC family transcriptional regulator of adaptative response / DNA-3-methyladenine glycosylase II
LAGFEIMLDADICTRALGARDPRFDGLFFVGITSTHIYCRPVCPARVSYPDHRRFFESAAAAEGAGFRPCLRCRPELAPGRAIIDAVPRLASVAAHRIAAGALNGRSVRDLAHDLGVSERHLRRALEREVGVAPLELAQTHRLLLAKRLLADTSLSVTRVAYASGFQSLRRFNAVFRERYRMSPTALRRGTRSLDDERPVLVSRESATDDSPLTLTLAYRPPLAWETLLDTLRAHALPGVESITGNTYSRTVRLDGRTGVVTVNRGDPRRVRTASSLTVRLSASLLPVLMPLLARLRRLFDLDAEPTIIDAQLRQGGLEHLVLARPGTRLPGAFDGFEAAFSLLVDDPRQIIETYSEPFETGDDSLTHLTPRAATIATAAPADLVRLGADPLRANALVAVAKLITANDLHLEPGSNVDETYRALTTAGVDDTLATTILMRALQWPDAFPSSDESLQSAAGASSQRDLENRAESWRPWRAYAALHLGLAHTQDVPRNALSA